MRYHRIVTMEFLMRQLASNLKEMIGKQVKAKGWVHSTRDFGKLLFLIIRDRSGFFQVVIEDPIEKSKLSKLTIGTTLSVEGEIVSSRCEFGCEIIAPKIEIFSKVSEAAPVEYTKPQMQAEIDFILDHRPIALRHEESYAIFKIQAEITHAYRIFMHDRVGAVEYFAPCMLGASSEGGSEFFTVDYFGYPATLAQSSQLYKQMMVGVYERVFALMPFFRAEPSHTTRHLSEGKQLEFEMGFFDNWQELLDIQEGALKFIVHHIETHCQHELALLGNPLARAPLDVPFPRLTFQEAQTLFYERTGIDERNEPDLSPRAERELCAWSRETKGTDFVFVIDWPLKKRPFYAYPHPKDLTLTNTMDLLCAGAEVSSGGQRRHTYESMLAGLEIKGMNPEAFGDYLSVFKYGMPPHGGFGMGLERLTQTLLGLKNIRQASLFPSDTKRIAGVRIKKKIIFGAENLRNEIIRLLKEQTVSFEHLTHAPTPSGSDQSGVKELDLTPGIKALILRGKSSKNNYQFNLLSHQKLDMKAVAELVGERCEFEEPQVIEERFGLKVGGVAPFGQLLNLQVFFDEEIAKVEKVAFNCGFSTESIILSSKDLISVVEPKLALFSRVV